MSTKDFTHVKAAIEKTTGGKGQQTTATPEEQQERKENLNTQGRKGCKAVRINMAFTPSNHQFIKIMSKINGMSMTEYTNLVVERYQEDHPDTYQLAIKLIEQENLKNKK